MALKWKTHDGRILYLCQMSQRHLRNCIRVLKGRLEENMRSAEQANKESDVISPTVMRKLRTVFMNRAAKNSLYIYAMNAELKQRRQKNAGKKPSRRAVK